MKTDPRQKIAEHIGMLVIANIEQQAFMEQQDEQIKQLQQRLHDARADERGPSGAVTPPDALAGS